MPMNPKLVSIIVPVYRAEKYIIQTIESVAAQTYGDWELLLVDDCGGDSSTDLITAWCNEHPGYNVRLIRQEQNAGAAKARNRGLEEAQGRYIAFLDADDLWYPDKLEKELRFMHKLDVGFVFTAYEFGDTNAVPTGKMVHAFQQQEGGCGADLVPLQEMGEERRDLLRNPVYRMGLAGHGQTRGAGCEAEKKK